MRGSSSINRNKADRKITDSELPARIKGIRSKLGLTQAEFALKLGVDRAQVGVWERGGDERPSIEKLLEIAGVAPDRGDRIWFWERAGVNLDLIKVDLREELRVRTAERDPNKTIDIPVCRHLAHNRKGKLVYTKDGSVALSSDLIDHPGTIACFASEKRPPWITRDGDLILIDRSITQPKDLWEKPTAVFFSGLLETREVPWQNVFPPRIRVGKGAEYIEQKKDMSIHLLNNIKQLMPSMEANLSKGIEDVSRGRYPTREFIDEMEKSGFHVIEDVRSPGLLVGWLHVIRAGGNLDVETDSPEFPPWRLNLKAQSPLSHYSRSIAISDWQRTPMPDTKFLTRSQVPLRSGIEILGHVVGWLSKQKS